jgi:hypothetical protein
MHSLKRRVEALEGCGGHGLELVLISWKPIGGRETATYDGVTYTQEARESAEQFRARLSESLQHTKCRFVWVSELDARL